MNTATIILWIIAGILILSSWKEGIPTLKQGVRLTWETVSRNSLLILLAFIIVGFVNILSPEQLIETWIGPSAGWRGILLSVGIGMLLPGGPYVVFPLIAILYEAGAGIAPVITLVTSWATLSLLTISFELPIMGWRFTAIRWSTSLLIPLLTGTIALFIWG